MSELKEAKPPEPAIEFIDDTKNAEKTDEPEVITQGKVYCPLLKCICDNGVPKIPHREPEEVKCVFAGTKYKLDLVAGGQVKVREACLLILFLERMQESHYLIPFTNQ